MDSSVTDAVVKANGTQRTVIEPKSEIPMVIVWKNVVVAVVTHIGALYGLYLAFTSALWQTLLFTVFIDLLSALGVTVGNHRLWSHRSYKAKLPLRIFLAILSCVADQGSIYTWARNHRVHHKYSDTDADPHNSKRGFFFSHIGWLLVRKHPEVVKKGKQIDLSDLLADPVVRFQKKYYRQLVVLYCYLLPTVMPTLFWGENLITSFFVATVMRYISVYHQAFCINSFAHMWGNKPYDKYIAPTDNIWTHIATYGEGFHNFHHSFPWDYSTSEYGMCYSTGTAFIDLMAWMGLAYDMKSAPPEMIHAKKKKTGEDRKLEMNTLKSPKYKSKEKSSREC